MIKGNKINLIPASLKDRQKVYEWCFRSETTKFHSGPPDFPDKPLADYDEFCRDYYEEYYFTGTRPEDGRGYIIEHGGDPVGFISYSSFHLKPAFAELDIWMNSEANCGKGFGTDAMIALGDYLHEAIGIAELIIAPSAKNIRAVKAYEKAGFEQTDRAMTEFLRDQYFDLYGSGDYGVDETALLVKQLTASR